jgi:uncharacterized protein (TIGR02147 family)
MRSIYEFQGYRDYLASYYAHHKEHTPGFSFNTFSRQAGLNSPNYLKLVTEGKRNLTVSNIHAFGRAMRLSTDELRYFEALVHLDQVEGVEEKAFYRARLDEIASSKPRRMKKLTIDGLISSWFYPAICSCLEGRDSQLAVAEIAQIVGIREEKVREAVGLLSSNGLVVEEDGKYRLRQDCILYHDKKILNQAQRRFLRQQIERSLEEFDRNYAAKSKFFSHTFTIEKSRYGAYVEKVKSFLESVAEMSAPEEVETVMQLNIQLFRLS